MSDAPPKDTTDIAANHQLLAQAVALHSEGRLDEAVRTYEQILSRLPGDFDATHLLGVVALQQGRFEAARSLIRAALRVNPHDASALINLGTSYMVEGQAEQAYQQFEFALKLHPDSSNALINAATALHNMGRYREAIPLLRKAHAADAKAYAVCNLLGACLIKSGEPREAAKFFEVATQTQPDDAEGWANLSVALNAIGEHARARKCADKADSRNPQSSTALAALAAAQFDQGRLLESVDSYRQAVSLPGPSAQMLIAYGNVLLAIGLNEEAIEQLQRAADLDQKNLTIRWAMAMARLKPICVSETDMVHSRSTFAEAMAEVATWYAHSEGINEPFSAVGVVQPFFLAYHPFNNRELLSRYGEMCTAWMETLPSGQSDSNARIGGNNPPRGGRRKLRLGIVSAHIRQHSVWNAITRGWVNHIDRTKFEIYLFQLNRMTDQATENARQSATHIEDQPTNLSAWVQAIRKSDLDAVIYPEIGMDTLTLQLACMRLAPVQAAAWGHPETTGLPTLDLFISADATEPANAPAHYSERLIRLPNLGVHVDPLKPAFIRLSLRSLNLPQNEPLLLCPGAPFKYAPQYDDVWVQIAKSLEKRFLRRNSGGRLVFFRSGSTTIDQMLEIRLRSAFGEAGVEFDARVSIIPKLDRKRFFGLMRRAALMLDTPGFSGFNTALQAIECDLPVLAFEGEFMRGRLASAIVRQLGMPELVAITKEEFVRKAIELAGDAGRCKRIRHEIIERRKVLFHDMAPVRALERHLTEAVMTAGIGSST